MLLTNFIIASETKRRQALAKVYALLILLAEESEHKQKAIGGTPEWIPNRNEGNLTNEKM